MGGGGGGRERERGGDSEGGRMHHAEGVFFLYLQMFHTDDFEVQVHCPFCRRQVPSFFR